MSFGRHYIIEKFSSKKLNIFFLKVLFKRRETMKTILKKWKRNISGLQNWLVFIFKRNSNLKNQEKNFYQIFIKPLKILNCLEYLCILKVNVCDWKFRIRHTVAPNLRIHLALDTATLVWWKKFRMWNKIPFFT